MRNWRLIIGLSLVLFLTFGFTAWRESIFNDRMNIDIQEMTARLQQSKVSADQVEVFRSSLLSLKQNISSFMYGTISNVIICIFVSILISLSAVQALISKPKDSVSGGT